MDCRHCNTPLIHTFIDLGFAPPSNAYLTEEDLGKPELYYPLNIKVCQECWLVQTEDYAEAESLFDSSYAYFSSTSRGWLKHAEDYCDLMETRFNLNTDSLVIELASNDGYLLKNFVAREIPCIGIEPTKSTADAAEKLGITVIREFFGEALGLSLAKQGKKADLIVGNNVYAHVPDINGFTKGLKAILKVDGVITLEFPHLMELIKEHQFDTIYHEHFSYLSLFTVKRIFESVGLRIFDVEKLQTHGGSLRVYGCHSNASKIDCPSVEKILVEEANQQLQNLKTYENFQIIADKIKNDVLQFLIDKKRERKSVVAYGAAAKANTLLNFAGVKPDLLPVIFDAAVSKQNKYMPGSHIPIVSPDRLKGSDVDYLIILPWNIKEEIERQLRPILGKEVSIVTMIPSLNIIK